MPLTSKLRATKVPALIIFTEISYIIILDPVIVATSIVVADRS
jgi:hypothetical protein